MEKVEMTIGDIIGIMENEAASTRRRIAAGETTAHDRDPEAWCAFIDDAVACLKEVGR